MKLKYGSLHLSLSRVKELRLGGLKIKSHMTVLF